MEQEQPPALAAKSADFQWTDGIKPAALRRMAEATRLLLGQPEHWIHRRVERIYFKDHEVVHHQVSVDFTLPKGMEPVSRFEEKDVRVAPLFLLAKDSPKPLRLGKRPRRQLPFFGKTRSPEPAIPMAPYSNINFTDQAEQRLPLLTRRQSSQLAERMLREEAERALEKPLSDKLKETISAIAYQSWLDLGDLLAWLLEEEPTYCWDERIELRKDKMFTELAYMLASHYLIVCLLIDGIPRRPIYKLSYDESFNDSKSKILASFFRSLGWAFEEYAVRLNEIGASASYHIEIDVPKELEINTVGLVGKHYGWYGNLESNEGRDYVIQQVERTSEGKVYIPQPLPGRRVGLTWVKLRARRSGFLVGALGASVFTTALLALAAYGAPEVLNDHTSEAAAAALLLVPTLIAAYIVRPDEHAITSKMLSWVRRMLMLNALFPALAVFFLITTHEDATTHEIEYLLLPPFDAAAKVAMEVYNSYNPLQGYWTVLAVLSFILSMLFTLSYILPIPYGETVYQPMPRTSEAGKNESTTP